MKIFKYTYYKFTVYVCKQRIRKIAWMYVTGGKKK